MSISSPISIIPIVVIGLFASAVAGLAWAIRTRQLTDLDRGARSVLDADGSHAPGELARVRAAIDRSARDPVLFFFASGVLWLVVGSALALIASIKLHTPGFLDGAEWLTFGRVRPAHMTTMIYGFASMFGAGVTLWLTARLCRTPLPFPIPLLAACALWNVGVLGGTVDILAGNSAGIEWLEIPVVWTLLIAAAFAVIMAASARMFAARRVGHVYVSQWYLLGAVVWFPFVYVAANWVVHAELVRGVVQASANWWYAHNVLGLWFTPIGLASAYYFIPKLIGRPVHSYQLSILGFWTLALFYNWAGTHHLIGGPLPAWVITVGIVGSVMMLVPVITVAINHHLTMRGHFGRLRHSPTLRFVVFGAMSYTVVSVQGALTALRAVNETTHFTHYTVAHAHLGVYAFFTMTMFGAFYYIAPRLTGAEFRSRLLIRVHFWATAVGMTLYFLGLSLGGVLQGLAMNDPDTPFLAVVQLTLPYLLSRTVAGVLMAIGHIAFAIVAVDMFLVRGKSLIGPTLFSRPPSTRASEVQP